MVGTCWLGLVDRHGILTGQEDGQACTATDRDKTLRLTR